MMESILPLQAKKPVNKLKKPFKQNNLRIQLIEAINDVLPTKKHALYQAGKIHFQNYGKLIRGITALMISDAIGLDKRCAMNWALAVELMHNASLVHDDICDGDTYRRANNTVWSAISERSAICFGDWLVAKSFEAALDCALMSDGKKIEAVRELARTMRNLCEGQSNEFTKTPITSWESYDKLVLAKTASLIVAAGEGPLILGEVNACQFNIKKALCHLGVAYQIHNDIDDILGKNLQCFRGDMKRRAPNAVTVAFKNLHINDSKFQFMDWISSNDTHEIAYWVQKFIDSDALEVCNRRSIKLVQLAESELDHVNDDLRSAFSPLIGYLEKSSQRSFN